MFELGEAVADRCRGRGGEGEDEEGQYDDGEERVGREAEGGESDDHGGWRDCKWVEVWSERWTKRRARINDDFDSPASAYIHFLALRCQLSPSNSERVSLLLSS